MKRLGVMLCVFAILGAMETVGRIKPDDRQDAHPVKSTLQKKPAIEKKYLAVRRREYQRDTVSLIDEDFEAGMPAGWAVIDGNNDGHTWTTGTTFDLIYVHPPNYGTAYAYYSDDDAGAAAPPGTEYLISPAVHCAGATTMTLSYSWGHSLMGVYLYGTTQVRSHDGVSWGSWITLAFFPYTANGVDTLDLNSYLPAESVQVQYTYEDPMGEWGMAFGIDNVLLEAEMPSFYVWDFETGAQGWTHTNGLSFPMAWDVQPSGLHPLQTPPEAGDSTMWIDDDASGMMTVMDTAKSPAIAPPSGMNKFKWGYSNYGGGGIYLNDLFVGITYYTGGAGTAVQLAHYPSGTISGPAWDLVDVAAYANADSIQAWFYFTDNWTWGYWACFDNVGFHSDAGYHDIGVTRILSPPMGGVPSGDYDWIARIQNLGEFPETGDIHAYIYDTSGMIIIFEETHTLTNFPAGGDTAIQFNTTIVVPNYSHCVVIVEMDDDNPTNDTLKVNSFVPESLGQHIYWIDAQTPTSSMILHGVEYDGTYFYLTGATALDETKVFMLDTLGNLIWAIDQPAHCTGWGWRDMAFDRAYIGTDRVDTLYASCSFNVDRFGINKIAGTLDYYGPLPGPVNPCHPLAYMPESLYFFTADTDFIFKFIKNGSFVYQVPALWLMYGATYDCDTLDGGWIWWSSGDTAAQFKKFNPNSMSFAGISFGCDYPSSGVGFAQDFRGMDVLFAIVNEPQADHIYGFFLRWSDSTAIAENSLTPKNTDFGFRAGMQNPIRKESKISFFLPCKNRVKLKVYDAAGRLVKTLVDDIRMAGNHDIRWDGTDNSGRNQPSGVYFLRLDAGRESTIRKLVLIE